MKGSCNNILLILYCYCCIKDNDLVVTKADKANSVVILTPTPDYYIKINEFLDPNISKELKTYLYCFLNIKAVICSSMLFAGPHTQHTIYTHLMV